jgi:phosphonate transport system substrate-binding protein
MMKIAKPIACILPLCLCLAALAGCGTGGSSGGADGATPPEAWPAKITIAQMPNENNPDTGTKHEGFRSAISEHLGIEVEIFEGAEYSVAIEAMRSGKLDISLVTPMSYYQATRVASIEPLVTTVSMGADPYKTVFLTRSDRDDINSLEDLRGKAFAFVDPASSSGYMYPKAHLLKNLGLESDRIESPGYFFETVVFSGKHDASLMGVAMGDYDAAAVALQTIRGIVDAGLIDEDDIKIIGETELIPNPCFIMRSDLPQGLKDKLREFYLAYEDETYFETLYGDTKTRFIEAKESDYAVVKDMVALLGIEE